VRVKGSRMPNFLSQLTDGEQARLLEELNYLNLEEIRGFCSARGIPYKIMAEYPNGKVKVTNDTDRKPICNRRSTRGPTPLSGPFFGAATTERPIVVFNRAVDYLTTCIA
jgi:hypothetical protein